MFRWRAVGNNDAPDSPCENAPKRRPRSLAVKEARPPFSPRAGVWLNDAVEPGDDGPPSIDEIARQVLASAAGKRASRRKSKPKARSWPRLCAHGASPPIGGLQRP